ncbi:TetR/AcrR family transcriptional regulator [Salinibacterium sp. M195]|uniref:TetR/AcrR family transcriptional regulator n=1 Tax=Salinibacterium sp. M195 TaxID=2583374 RepID=UPI001C63713F|nr:TetR/AcrR family transcriptional regulator [Salinibacterium sp. M195]QYH36317.1 TetR/AcrR family transcriptional regulator [Salinibacterium sp. M195]
MPSTSPETRLTSRQKLLDTAATLFYSRGINATGVDTVIAQAGVAKGSMYHHFASKEALITAYLDREADAWLERVGAADDARAAPADRVARLFAALADQIDAGTFYGCPFTNAAIECPEMPDVQTSIARYRRILHAHVASLLNGVGGEALVANVTVVYDGALTSAKLAGTAGGVRQVGEFARAIVAAQS